MQHKGIRALALAISSIVILNGCIGGGGGGGSSSSGSPSDSPAANPDGPADGDTGGQPTAPDGDTEVLFAYNVTIDTPQLTTELKQVQSNAELLIAAISAILAPHAHAQSISMPRPEDVRVALMSGDDNGTPNDASDDLDLYLTLGTDYQVSQAGSSLVVQLPFQPRIDHYIEIATSGAPGLRVPTYQTNLVADAVSTFVTHMIASRSAQFEQLTVEEVEELLEDIRTLALDPAIITAIERAYASTNSIEALTDAIGAELYSIVEARLEERLTPPFNGNILATVDGEYYFQTFDLSAFEAYSRAGLIIGGASQQATITSKVDNEVRFSVHGADNFNYEAKHSNGLSFSVEVHTSIREETETSSLKVDGRGLTSPGSLLTFPYEQIGDSTGYTNWTWRCEEVSADCSDQREDSQRRLMTAGPTSAPFSTLVSGTHSDRLVTDSQGGPELTLINGSLEVGVRKPTTPQPLVGRYGILAIGQADTAGSLHVSTRLIDATHAEGEVSYCSRTSQHLIKPMFVHSPFEYSSSNNDDCLSADATLTFTANASFGEMGELSFDRISRDGWREQFSGYASADGLTYLSYRQAPDMRALTEFNQTEIFSRVGNRTIEVAVKLDSSDTSLANKRYRLMGLGIGAGQYLMETDRVLAGSLEFDSAGVPTIQTVVQSARVLEDNTRQTQSHLASNYTFSTENTYHQDGRLRMSTQQNHDGVLYDTTFDGYVQEGGRMLVLRREVKADDGFRLIGPMIAVCLNCD